MKRELWILQNKVKGGHYPEPGIRLWYSMWISRALVIKHIFTL